MPTALQIVQRYRPNVKEVMDAKRAIHISVTEDDCARGSKKKPDACAMVKALEKEYDGAIVASSVAYLIRGDKAYRFRTPASVARERRSDRNQNFAPGRYSFSPTSRFLAVPGEGHRLGGRQGNKPKIKKGALKKKAEAKTVSYKHRTTGIRSL